MHADAILEAIRSRRSIRAFTDRRPDNADLERLIEAACWAPSNHNRQGWKFIVFENQEAIRRLAGRVRTSVRDSMREESPVAAGHIDEVVHYAGVFENAPVVILAMHKKTPAVARRMIEAASGPLVSGEALSTAMAVQNLCLAAHAMGLGSCVMTAPLLAGDVWRGLSDLPAGFEPTCLVAVGYSAEKPDPPRRKELRHVVEYR